MQRIVKRFLLNPETYCEKKKVTVTKMMKKSLQTFHHAINNDIKESNFRKIKFLKNLNSDIESLKET